MAVGSSIATNASTREYVSKFRARRTPTFCIENKFVSIIIKIGHTLLLQINCTLNAIHYKFSALTKTVALSLAAINIQ